jgi:hypothetical protein
LVNDKVGRKTGNKKKGRCPRVKGLELGVMWFILQQSRLSIIQIWKQVKTNQLLDVTLFY